jgi:NADH-quinone oxidoreductase subunit F
MMHLTDRIAAGQAAWEDVELLHDVASQVKGKCLCALGEFSIEAVLSGIERFEADFRQSAPTGQNQTVESAAVAD